MKYYDKKKKKEIENKSDFYSDKIWLLSVDVYMQNLLNNF